MGDNRDFVGNTYRPLRARSINYDAWDTEARRQGSINVGGLFKRHFSGDYGEIDDEDKNINERSIKDGSCIVSGYDTDAGRVLVITDPESELTQLPDYVEGHRAFTSMILAEEYLNDIAAREGVDVK